MKTFISCTVFWWFCPHPILGNSSCMNFELHGFFWSQTCISRPYCIPILKVDASLAKTFPGANQQAVAELEANRTELLKLHEFWATRFFLVPKNVHLKALLYSNSQSWCFTMKRASLAKTFPGSNQQAVVELEANRTELLSTKMAAQYICTFKSMSYVKIRFSEKVANFE